MRYAKRRMKTRIFVISSFSVAAEHHQIIFQENFDSDIQKD
jgi:hypothetical protein